MIRITVELLPGGDEKQPRPLGTAMIANDGTGDAVIGNYSVVLSKWGCLTKPGKPAACKGFPERQEDLGTCSIWLLEPLWASVIPERDAERKTLNRTKIEWADFTWNPVTGCWGPGGTAEKPNRCWYCYAQKIAERFNTSKIGGESIRVFKDPFRPTLHPERLSQPEKIKRPSRIFVCSMGDLFGDWVPADWIRQVLAVVGRNPRHTFIFLTKNPARYREFNPWLGNCWLGVTVTNQHQAETEIPVILQADAAVRFASLEPFFGPIKFKKHWLEVHTDGQWLNVVECGKKPESQHLNWLIIGALTGSGARKWKPQPEWVQSLIDQARAANVPVFLKDNLHWPEEIREWPLVPTANYGGEAC